jgi:cytochrome d ubiquinol oxidase subunit I
VLLPLLANSAGWIFTEMGRQPWIVFGLMRTADGTSASVGAGSVATSLVVLTVLYGVLAVVEIGLLVRYAVAGPPPAGIADAGGTEPPPADDQSRPLTFAY